jgi:hypothetical protein
MVLCVEKPGIHLEHNWDQGIPNPMLRLFPRRSHGERVLTEPAVTRKPDRRQVWEVHTQRKNSIILLQELLIGIVV